MVGSHRKRSAGLISLSTSSHTPASTLFAFATFVRRKTSTEVQQPDDDDLPPPKGRIPHQDLFPLASRCVYSVMVMVICSALGPVPPIYLRG